jgi:hypothetical protein
MFAICVVSILMNFAAVRGAASRAWSITTSWRRAA